MKKQSGFAVLEAILILVIIAIIGGTGYFVWHSHQETNKVLDGSGKAVGTTKPTKITNFEECAKAGNPIMESYPEQCSANGKTFVNDKQKAPQPPTNQEQQYLQVKEWGVKIPLTADISDAYYIYKNGAVYLSKVSYKSTDCAADATSLGLISRSTDGTTKMRSVGGFYYTYVHPQAACGFANPNSSDSSTDIGVQKASQYMASFKTAVDKIQKN